MKLSKLVSDSIILSSAVLAVSVATISPASAKTAVYNWEEGIDLLNNDRTDDNQLWGLDNSADRGGSLSAQIVTQEKLAAVPEPATMSFLSLSALGFATSVLNRRQGKSRVNSIAQKITKKIKFRGLIFTY